MSTRPNKTVVVVVERKLLPTVYVLIGFLFWISLVYYFIGWYTKKQVVIIKLQQMQNMEGIISMNLIDRFIKPVHAHCDVPCGIYETDTMRHAADTCLRMIDKIEALEESDGGMKSEAHNNFIRMVMTKERHAQLCKDQIYVLWSDFFKPEHLEKYPDLHERLWHAAKQSSKVKQTISREEAQKLVDMVHEIAHIFDEAQAKA